MFANSTSAQLTAFQKRYQNAKTRATKKRVFNQAMLNLSQTHQTAFVKWQTQFEESKLRS